MTEFEKQVSQIASLGVWQIVTGHPMKRQLIPVEDDRWSKKTGLFVTLKKGSDLRGSMGLLESTTTLPETLFDAAQTAATHDQRYPPITPEELPSIEINVSLLSEIKKLKSKDDVKIGKTGLIISRGEKQGVLLPEVAIQNKWTPEQFLEATCEKAQLSHKAWQDPNTLVEYFTCHEIVGGKITECIKDYV